MGCDPCLPVPAFNRFNEAVDKIGSADEEAPLSSEVLTITPRTFDPSGWPVQPGEYTVLNPSGFIAVISSGETDAEFRQAVQKNIAVIGSLTTENIGIEYLVKNLISNPYIRHLVIVAREVPGHCPVDALINLSRNGIDENRRILHAKGARPVLKNVGPREINHFRQQISVHNWGPLENTSLICERIMALSSLKSLPFERGIYIRQADVIEASVSNGVQLDPEGYFIILLRKGKKNPLYVEHYKNSGRLLHVFKGKNAAVLCSEIIRRNLVSRLDHAAYLGRELARAENALAINEKYVQDKAV